MSQATAPAPARQRLMSLDVFRGMTIALMILVNNPGNWMPFSQLSHSQWNGWTLTDLVFPFFMFIVGVSIVLSTAGRIEKGESKGKLLLHTLRRAAIIFALGLFINAFPNFVLHSWRIPGVLQRIAVCYLFASLLFLFTNTRVRWALTAFLLVGYWVMMRFVPVPGIGAPGVDIPLLHPDNNLVAWLDRKLMMGHLYEGVRDPEGILSTFPALANVLFGAAVGEWIRNFRNDSASLLKRLVVCGLACFAAAELWNLFFPINKKLWTSSYVLLTVGLAMLVLALCYWMLDVRSLRGRWTKPGIVFGTNAIVAYVFSEVLAILGWTFKVNYQGRQVAASGYLYSVLLGWIHPLQLASLAYSVAFVGICYLVVWLLYRKQIFVKI